MVWVLERPDDDVKTTDDGCYDYAYDSVLLKAELDLKSDQNEDAIREELKAVFLRNYILTLVCMILSL